MEALAAKRSEVGRATGGLRSDYEDVKTNAKKLAEYRKEAAVIQVANGGAPVRTRTPATPAVVVPAFDQARDDLVVLVLSKIPSLSISDLNEVNELIDALTYPLRNSSAAEYRRPVQDSLTAWGVTLKGELMRSAPRPQPLAEII
jgi:hypothetical protein